MRTPSPAGMSPSVGGVRPGKSPSRCGGRRQELQAISREVRLRTSFCVPVWQNVQVSVQPTWLDTHKRTPIGFSGI